VPRSFQGRSTQRFARQPARRPGWSVGPGGVISQTASGTSLFGATAVAAEDDVTVIRTRGELTLFLSAATAALDGFEGAVGICKVTENAAGVGVTAVPSPVADIAWDGWLWYQFFSVKAMVATFSTALQGASVFARYVVDSKAMRKLNNTDNVVAVLEATEIGTAVLNARLDTRLLSKSMS